MSAAPGQLRNNELLRGSVVSGFANPVTPVDQQILDVPRSAGGLVSADQPASGFDLLAMLLEEQRSLETASPTAVQQFSAWHATAAEMSEPIQSRYYKDLIPDTSPAAGQQLAFQVDLDLCSGCKACVVACHTLNGLDDGESFRDVGLLIGDGLLTGDGDQPVMQHVTTACHHCVDPGCLNACPVNAYEKDPVTGIVSHLDDQCFGCQYCTLACPYNVPRYHASKGIVRKCDMCSQRLSAGAAPACVQACPHQAISIQIVSVEEHGARLKAQTFLSDSPDPGLTRPATVFTGSAAERMDLRESRFQPDVLEHAHPPLILLLLLSQISVGLMGGANIVWSTMPDTRQLNFLVIPLIIAAAMAVISAMASTLHLGRPQFAFRAMLGLRHSWLSREILAFGVYIPLTLLTALASAGQPGWLQILLPAATVTGIVGVSCSAMIYHITHRPYWHVMRSGLSFFLGAIWGATALLNLCLTFAPLAPNSLIRVFCLAGCMCALMRGGLTIQSLSWHDQSTHASRTLSSTSRRLRGPLRPAVQILLTATAVGIFTNGWVAVNPSASGVTFPALISLAAAVLAESLDRFLFFRAVVPLHMPGVNR